MKSAHRQDETSGITLLLKCVKAALAACILAIILILGFALLLKWETLTESSIPLINTIIKVICAVCSGFFAANGCPKNAWLWSGISGAIFILASFVSFSIIENVFSFSLALLSDLALGFFSAMLGGMLLRVFKG